MAHKVGRENNALRESDGYLCEFPPGILRISLENNEVSAYGMLMPCDGDLSSHFMIARALTIQIGCGQSPRIYNPNLESLGPNRSSITTSKRQNPSFPNGGNKICGLDPLCERAAIHGSSDEVVHIWQI